MLSFALLLDLSKTDEWQFINQQFSLFVLKQFKTIKIIQNRLKIIPTLIQDFAISGVLWPEKYLI